MCHKNIEENDIKEIAKQQGYIIDNFQAYEILKNVVKRFYKVTRKDVQNAVCDYFKDA